MGSAPRYLYVLFDGLWDTVIDSQVLLHVRTMREQGIADMEVWTFACSGELYEKSLRKLPQAEALCGGAVRVFPGVRPASPLSGLRNALRLLKHLSEYKPAFEGIHARTEYAVVVCGWLKALLGFSLIWDCRGDSEAEFRARFVPRTPLHRLAGWLHRLVLRSRVFLAARLCDRAIFVSRPLREAMAGGLGNRPWRVIPCTAPEEIFFFDQALRSETRRGLGYGPEHTVFVYSGSMAPYQCFPETVALFRALHRENPAARLLVLTPQLEAAQERLRDLPEGVLHLAAARIGEVNAYLNAADYAFLLRAQNAVNRAASPTKFAEYGLAGLPVIMSDSVPDSHALARECGNVCPWQGGKADLAAGPDRSTVMEFYRQRLTKGAVLDSYRAIYASPEK